jgi:hypothetical protein
VGLVDGAPRVLRRAGSEEGQSGWRQEGKGLTSDIHLGAG